MSKEQARLRNQLQKLCQNLNIGADERKRYLLGKVLTVTDGAIADPDQRKAVKNLVQDAFWTESSFPGTSPVTFQVEQLAEANGFPLWETPEDNAVAPKAQNEYETV